MRFCLLSFVLMAMATLVRADDKLIVRLAELQQKTEQAEQLRRAAEPTILDLRQQATQLQQLLAQRKKECDQSAQALKDLDGKLKKANEAFNKAEKEKQQAIDAAAKANQTAETAKGTDKEKEAADQAKSVTEKLTVAVKAFDSRQAELTDLQTKAAAAKAQTEERQQQLEQAESTFKPFETDWQAAEAKFAQLETAASGRLQAWESLLFETGRRISFARQIAPIFSQRCVACHNARTAKGRLNLENYAHAVKGGESGDGIVPGQPEDSLLLTMLADGSMPKEGERLSAEQVALVRRWITEGAKLDAGVNPRGLLVTIIPKGPQPAPPEKYRFPVPVLALAFHPSGDWLATAGYREVLLWNTADGQLTRRIANLAERPHDLKFSPDGQKVFVAAGTPGQIGEVKSFDVNDGQLIADYFTTDDEVFALALNADGTRLAVASADRSVRVFDVATRKQTLLIEDHADWVMDVVWSPDSTRLATASRDKTAKVFDAVSGESLATFSGHNQPLFGIGFLTDGQQLVSSGRDAKLRVWTIKESKQLREMPLGGEGFRVISQADGFAYVGSADQNVRQFNLANGQKQQTFEGHRDWVYSVALHPSTKRLATGSHDGEVRLWNLADGKPLLNFKAKP